MQNTSLRLTVEEQSMLTGGMGPGQRRAMMLLCKYADSVGAEELLPITAAHIDSCLYHGQSSLDFVASFTALKARVSVPTTLNVGALDALHPELNQGGAQLLARQLALTNAYVSFGCLPTLTCAPYQRRQRPRLGDQIAWAESNAIVFANSVLGARSERYGDFIDLCAAITARVPAVGLHLDGPRKAGLIVEVASVDRCALVRELYFAAVGYCLGKLVGGRVAALTGLPGDSSEDELKALGAAAASAGAVAMFHVVGVTPEARSLDEATGARGDLPVLQIDSTGLQQAVAELCLLEEGEPVAAVCLGTPHFSMAEFRSLARQLPGRESSVEFYVSTSREIASEIEAEPWFAHLADFGVTIVVDTCTYLAPVVRAGDGAVLTNSGKWAHYGPGNLRRRTGLMEVARCLRCAEAGHVTR